MIASADVVVVGSGAFGASAASHLARRGVRVAVLERARLASQTSPRAAGLSGQVRATPALTKLAQRAVAKLAAFTDETGRSARRSPSGSSTGRRRSTSPRSPPRASPDATPRRRNCASDAGGPT